MDQDDSIKLGAEGLLSRLVTKELLCRHGPDAAAQQGKQKELALRNPASPRLRQFLVEAEGKKGQGVGRQDGRVLVHVLGVEPALPPVVQQQGVPRLEGGREAATPRAADDAGEERVDRVVLSPVDDGGEADRVVTTPGEQHVARVLRKLGF